MVHHELQHLEILLSVNAFTEQYLTCFILQNYI